jgi:hypothetical protein
MNIIGIQTFSLCGVLLKKRMIVDGCPSVESSASPDSASPQSCVITSSSIRILLELHMGNFIVNRTETMSLS